MIYMIIGNLDSNIIAIINNILMKMPVPSSFSLFRVVTSDGVPEEIPTWPIANRTPGSNTPLNTSQCDRKEGGAAGALVCVSLITGEADPLPPMQTGFSCLLPVHLLGLG